MTAVALVSIEVDRQVLDLNPSLTTLVVDRVRCAAGAEELGWVDVLVLPREGPGFGVEVYSPDGLDTRTFLLGQEVIRWRLEDLAADIVGSVLLSAPKVELVEHMEGVGK